MNSSPSPGRVLTLDSFPPEISQRYLALCDPVDVAAFAQTSRANRAFVYHSYDQVLWREMYLELFDDPRITDPSTALHWSRTSNLNLWQSGLCERISARQVFRGLKRALIASQERGGGNMDPENLDVDLVRFDVIDDDMEVVEALRVLVTVLDTARPNPNPQMGVISDEDRQSRNLEFVESMLDHPLVRKLVWDHAPAQGKMYSAKLHVHYGMSDWDTTTVRGRGQAREKVYLLSTYNEKNRWGPYLADYSRRPNWEQLEAMMLVVGRNVKDRLSDWRLPETDIPKMGLRHARNHSIMPTTTPSLSNAPATVPGDWAGVTGKWYRVVCFMDYRDLWGYNYGDFLSYNPDFLATYQEAVRVMSFNLSVVSIGKPPKDIAIRGANVRTPPLIRALTRSRHMQDGYFLPSSRNGNNDDDDDDGDDEDDDNDDDDADGTKTTLGGSPWITKTTSPSSSISSASAFSSLFEASPTSSSSASPQSASSSKQASQSEPAYPTIYFSGTVQSSDAWHPTSYVHGRVERADNGTVYWKLTSNYDGQDRWVSEGVQIGGVASKMGVLGIWSDAYHEHEGPAGPFWFWKGQ